MKLNKLLNIEYPLIQGGMANIATGEFAASVSNAGALGLIGAGGMDTATLKKNIEICRNLTDKPFGVNIMLINPCADEMAQLVIDEKVPVVTTGAGNPGKYVAAWKAAGIKVLPVVPSVALAKRLEKYNVDAIIVEGTEAGGHIGELTTMALVPQVVEAVSVPVIAAGGIASGKQVLAAYALGACGVQVGKMCIRDSFLTSESSNPLRPYRNVGKITRIVKNTRNPYLIGNDQGWVNDQVIEGRVSYLSNPNYVGDSLVGALQQINVDTSFENRQHLAKLNGITNYVGSAAQNLQLLQLLKEGKLIS